MPRYFWSFSKEFKSNREDEERESTPKGKSKILPTDKKMKALKAINSDMVKAAQILNKQETATLDMDTNIIVSNKRNAKVSYKKEKSYQPFNVYGEEQDVMVPSEFRDGNVPPGFEQLPILQEAELSLPESV